MGAVRTKKQTRMKRKMRIRKKISGTSDRPRLTVFRSLKNIYAQIIDDTDGHTLVSASSIEKWDVEGEGKPKFESKVDEAKHIGQVIGKRSIEKGIQQVVFDRNGYLYHGRVKAVSDGARESGLIF
jgi:large subunit ribosomal protein L18